MAKDKDIYNIFTFVFASYINYCNGITKAFSQLCQIESISKLLNLCWDIMLANIGVLHWLFFVSDSCHSLKKDIVKY